MARIDETIKALEEMVYISMDVSYSLGRYSKALNNFSAATNGLSKQIQKSFRDRKLKCAYCGNTSGLKDSRGGCVSCGGMNTL